MLLDISSSALRKIKEGDTQSLKLDGALRLCKRLRISPWELAGESEPANVVVSMATGAGKTSIVALLRMLAQREGFSLLLDPGDEPRVEWQAHLERRVDDLVDKLAATNEALSKLGRPAKTLEAPKHVAAPPRTKVGRR